MGGPGGIGMGGDNAGGAAAAGAPGLLAVVAGWLGPAAGAAAWADPAAAVLAAASVDVAAALPVVDAADAAVRAGPGQYGGLRQCPQESPDAVQRQCQFHAGQFVWDAQTFSLNGSSAQAGLCRFERQPDVRRPSQDSQAAQGNNGMFMINYQLRRSRNGTTQIGTMPTALERSGDFSQAYAQGPVTIYDPLSGAPFPNNLIRPTASTPRLWLWRTTIRFPRPGYTRNYSAAIRSLNNSDNINARVMNISVTKKDRLSGGVGYMGGNSTSTTCSASPTPGRRAASTPMPRGRTPSTPT